MKHIISVSVDEETVYKLREILRKRGYKSKSTVVEKAILKMHEGEIN
jgi:metal-responsive CopG/Arc/MetJ family transcriptional regulator